MTDTTKIGENVRCEYLEYVETEARALRQRTGKSLHECTDIVSAYARTAFGRKLEGLLATGNVE